MHSRPIAQQILFSNSPGLQIKTSHQPHKLWPYHQHMNPRLPTKPAHLFGYSEITLQTSIKIMHAPLPTGTTTPEPGSPLEPRKHNIIGKPIRNGNHSPLACTTANTDERPTKLRTYDIVVRDTPDPRRKIGILSMKPDTPSHIMINVKPLHAIITSHVGLVTVARSLATRKPTPRWHRNTNYVISFARHTSH